MGRSRHWKRQHFSVRPYPLNIIVFRSDIKSSGKFAIFRRLEIEGAGGGGAVKLVNYGKSDTKDRMNYLTYSLIKTEGVIGIFPICIYEGCILWQSFRFIAIIFFKL